MTQREVASQEALDALEDKMSRRFDGIEGALQQLLAAVGQCGCGGGGKDGGGGGRDGEGGVGGDGNNGEAQGAMMQVSDDAEPEEAGGAVCDTGDTGAVCDTGAVTAVLDKLTQLDSKISSLSSRKRTKSDKGPRHLRRRARQDPATDATDTTSHEMLTADAQGRDEVGVTRERVVVGSSSAGGEGRGGSLIMTYRHKAHSGAGEDTRPTELLRPLRPLIPHVSHGADVGIVRGECEDGASVGPGNPVRVCLVCVCVCVCVGCYRVCWRLTVSARVESSATPMCMHSSLASY